MINTEGRLKITLDNIFIGCAIIGFDWQFLYVNDAAAKEVFRSKEDFKGKTLLELFPNIVHSPIFSNFKCCMETATRMEFEEKYVFTNGVSKYFEIKAEPVHEGIFVMFLDITKRKEAEKNILKNQRLLEESQRIAHLGSWEMNLATNVVTWSDEVFRIFEIDRAEFGASYEALLSLIHPEDKEYLDKSYKEALTNKTPYDVLYRLKFPGGRIKYLHSQAETFYNKEGAPVRSVGIVHDITQQKQAEIQLQENEYKYQQVVENINDGLAIDDMDGRIVYANKQFLKLFGLEKEDIKNLSLQDYIAPEYFKQIIERHNKRMAGDDVPDILEFIGCRKDGTRRWYEGRVSKVFEHGQIVGTQAIIRDITDVKESIEMLKQSETEKTKLLDELAKKYNELMQFNYIVSHNLRAPIANILGFCEIINLPNIEAHDKEEIFAHLKTAAMSMDSLIKDLNVILSLKSPLNEKKEKFSLRSIIDTISFSLEKQIIESGTVININISEEVRNIVTIKSYMESILYNLISNSIKYKSPERAPYIKISAWKNNKELCISVADNGIGIDLAKNDQDLFGLYKRFNFEVEGSGLGLHITKVEAEAIGGSISVESELNKGTTFTVTIPFE